MWSKLLDIKVVTGLAVVMVMVVAIACSSADEPSAPAAPAPAPAPAAPAPSAPAARATSPPPTARFGRMRGITGVSVPSTAPDWATGARAARSVCLRRSAATMVSETTRSC